MRGMLVHDGPSKALVRPCLWKLLCGLVSLRHRKNPEVLQVPVCSLTRMADMMLWFVGKVTSYCTMTCSVADLCLLLSIVASVQYLIFFSLLSAFDARASPSKPECFRRFSYASRQQPTAYHPNSLDQPTSRTVLSHYTMLRTTRLLSPAMRRAPFVQHRMQSTYQPPDAPKPEASKSNPHVGRLQPARTSLSRATLMID